MCLLLDVTALDREQRCSVRTELSVVTICIRLQGVIQDLIWGEGGRNTAGRVASGEVRIKRGKLGKVRIKRGKSIHKSIRQGGNLGSREGEGAPCAPSPNATLAGDLGRGHSSQTLKGICIIRQLSLLFFTTHVQVSVCIY